MGGEGRDGGDRSGEQPYLSLQWKELLRKVREQLLLPGLLEEFT